MSLVWWTQRSSSDEQALLDGQLTGSYPSMPTSVWTVDADELGGEQFVSALPTEGRYGTLGAISDGETIVTLVGDQFTSAGSSHRLVGVHAETGQTWTLDRDVLGCSDSIVDHAIVCRGETDMLFVDTRTGDVSATVPLPNSRMGYQVAYNGSAAYVASYTPSERTTTFYKVTPEGVEWQRSTSPQPEGYPGSGDASQFTATDELVASASINAVVVSADDGTEIVNRAALSNIGRLHDGSLTLNTGEVSDGVVANRAVTVVRPDGTTLDLPGGTATVPLVASEAQQNMLFVDGNYTDNTTGQTRWTTDHPDVSQFGTQAVLADDREVIVYGRDSLIALSTSTGAELWTTPAQTGYRSSGRAVTDGERVIVSSPRGGLSAVDLATGSSVWTQSATALGNVPTDGNSQPGPVLTFAAGDRLVTVTDTTITGFAPTGPLAIVPGAVRSASGGGGPGNGGDEYVTPCGSPPIFTPQSFGTSTAGLEVTMKVTAKCPGGDVLFGPQTRITITDGGDVVASGTFDFSASPVAIPPGDGGDAGMTMQLTYPSGTFFRLPDTLSEQMNAGGNRILVECEKGMSSGAPPRLPVPGDDATAPAVAAAGPALPAGTDVAATSADALRMQADSDRSFILANLNNHWVAQLSSKRPGLVADGRTWDNQAILDEFLALRLRFKDVRLLYSNEWSVFSYKGWWVTVAAATFPGPDAANNWCRAQGFDRDHCFAKLVSTTAGPDGSTKYWG
ncbi:PQQ-binding-like beta-propeller repeat protein [Gordonia sp. NPDC062954]|uniref:outer membrane protein assembly factor BamB family protein n=1 Tax=Gordonia sp. NPDC062954 TaxID=3364003 RepID=UPI0037C93AF9